MSWIFAGSLGVMNLCCSVALYYSISLEDLGLLLSSRLILMEKDLKYYWGKICGKCSYSYLLFSFLNFWRFYCFTGHTCFYYTFLYSSSSSILLGFFSCHPLILRFAEATILKLVLLHKFWLYKYHFCTFNNIFVRSLSCETIELGVQSDETVGKLVLLIEPSLPSFLSCFTVLPCERFISCRCLLTGKLSIANMR